MNLIYQNGMTSLSGGNISILDENGDMWITPSAIDKGSFTEEDIACVKKDGTKAGRHKPSSEYPIHRAIYHVRPDIKAIIHAHSPALVTFSIVGQIPDTSLIPRAQRICGKVGYAPYELPGSEKSGKVIADVFQDESILSVIMENHAVVVGGTDIIDAYSRLETMEYCALTILNSSVFAEGPTFISEHDRERLEQNPSGSELTNTSKNHFEHETNIRREISEMTKRAYTRGLMLSLLGTISVRLHNNSFLINPPHSPRWEMEPDDIVLIHDGTDEENARSNHIARLHRKIYTANPHINSIIQTQPLYLMSFAASNDEFDTRTIPECWILLQDLPLLPFEAVLPDNNSIPNLLNGKNPAVIIKNDSIIVTGNKLLQAFDRLEVAEFNAKSLIFAKKLGSVVPINNERIKALEKKFLS